MIVMNNRTPGRPASPKLHPRTRPEAEEIATKHRTTHDWVRHDPNMVVTPAHVPNRRGDQRAEQIAEKQKNEAGNWFSHSNGDNQTKPNSHGASPAGPKIRSKEALNNYNQTKQDEGKWYKFEDNKNYRSPHPTSKMGSESGEDIRQKMKGKSNQWYLHEHSANDSYRATPPKQRQGASGSAREIKEKMKTDNITFGNQDSTAERPSQLETGVNGYARKQRKGTASDWYGHHEADAEQGQGEMCFSPRVGSNEGYDNALRARGESNKWYSHDGSGSNGDRQAAPARAGSPLARELTLEKSRGQEAQNVMRHDVSAAADGNDVIQPRVKPEAVEAQQRNRGTMGKYMDQDANTDYLSARPNPRVKPEAQEIHEKNRGAFDQCLQGYPDPAPARSQKRIRPEAAENAAKNKGDIGSVLAPGAGGGARPGTASRPGSRIRSQEASEYAERNKGSINGLMHSYGCMSIDPAPVQRIRSEAGQEMAVKGRGTLGPVMRMESQ